MTPSHAEAIAPTVWTGPPELAITVPPSHSIGETLSRFDPKTARRSSLLKSLSAPAGTDERYEPGPVLGQGGMGVVVLAKDRDLARPVALKQLKMEPPSAQQVERFLREAQVTAQLEHPGIVPVHDVGADEAGRFYYVMRLVKGEQTLRRVIQRLKEGDLEAHALYTIERRVRIVQQVAHILEYAHRRGVVHRDVKPENVMVGPFGEVYLLDWGLAKLVGKGLEKIELGPGSGDGSETQAGSIVGTPYYMAPEQLQGGAAEPRTDVYALTAVLYELVTLHHYLGKPSSISEVVTAVETGRHKEAWKHYDRQNGRVPRALSSICDRGLEKRSEDRFASAAGLEAALQAWSEGDTPVCCPATLLIRILTVWRRAVVRHPALFGMLTFVFPVAIAVLLVVTWLTRVLAS